MEASITLNPILHQVHGTLSNSPYVSTRNVQVDAEAGRVRLEGTVHTYFQKQMAQELVRRIDGVEAIENLLQVNWAPITPR